MSRQTLTEAWPDVWSEYRRTFDLLKLDEELAGELITAALEAIDDDERQASAVLLFGVRGEQLHRVLAELPRRILDAGRWRA